MSPEDSGQATTPVPMAPDSLLPTEDPAAEESPAAETPMRQVNLRIGRAPDNDLVLDDLIVSRYHAELRSTPDGRYEIADLGSHNGTYLNGRRSAQLRDRRRHRRHRARDVPARRRRLQAVRRRPARSPSRRRTSW